MIYYKTYFYNIEYYKKEIKKQLINKTEKANIC